MKYMSKVCCAILLSYSPTLFAENYYDNSMLRWKPDILKVDDLESKTIELLEAGFIPVSKEKFRNYSYDKSMRDIKKKALQHGAQVIIFSNIPLSSETIFDVRIMGNDKNKNDVHNLNNIPVGTIQRTPVRMSGSSDEYTVLYFYKFDSITGIYPVELSDREKIYNGIQTGVVAKVIRQGSPAQNVILPQDIILKMNDENIVDTSAFVESSNYLKGNTVKFEILRKGEKLHKELKLD